MSAPNTRSLTLKVRDIGNGGVDKILDELIENEMLLGKLGKGHVGAHAERQEQRVVEEKTGQVLDERVGQLVKEKPILAQYL